jgi:hypothetical protein
MQPYEWVRNPLDLAGLAPSLRNYNGEEPRRPDPIRIEGGNRPTNNPRDNLVTLMAFTSGEESFIDANNNGVYDANEKFDDLTEPFVDGNDNATHDEDERFIDANGNGVWDGKNDRWDANTLIWVQDRILWTGIPALEDSIDIPTLTGHRKVFADITPAKTELKCPATGTVCAQAGDPLKNYGPMTVTAYMADPWFNSMAQNGEDDGCELKPEPESPVKIKATSNKGMKFTYPAGEYMTFWISDVRDPKASATEQVPKRDPAIGFAVPVECTYTASPISGHVVSVFIGRINGTIE